jgi:hypothetical protein
MKPNELMRTLKKCSEVFKFSILKALETHGEMKYTVLKNYVKIDDSAKFHYHLRTLSKIKCVGHAEDQQIYFITERGKRMVSLLENVLSEKFISEELQNSCRNSTDGNHQYVEVCRRCSHIREVEK